MNKHLKNLARKRRPDAITHTRMIWTLLNLGFFQVRLVLLYRSEDLSVPTACTRDRKVFVIGLEGELREHRKGDFSPREGKDFYHTIQGGEIWTSTHYAAPFSFWYRKGDVRSIELMPAMSTSEKIIDFNEWATAEELVSDAERQAWLLTLSLGK